MRIVPSLNHCSLWSAKDSRGENEHIIKSSAPDRDKFESLFTSEAVTEFHLTCHKHPASWPQHQVNNLAGCCMPSKQAVKQFCTKCGLPAVQHQGTEQYLLLMHCAELLTAWPKIRKSGKEWQTWMSTFLQPTLKLFCQHMDNHSKHCRTRGTAFNIPNIWRIAHIGAQFGQEVNFNE